jgi:hypothetical protein
MRRGSAPRWIAFAAVASGVAVVVGCIASGAAPTRSSPPTASRPITAAEGALLDRAEQLMLRACMRRAGFRYWIVSSQDQAPAGPGGPYVLGDPSWARRHGYGTDLRVQQDRAARKDPNARYFAGLPPARQRAALVALNGPGPKGLQATLPNGIHVQHSSRGCVSMAQRQLYGDLTAWYRTAKLAENLPGERYGLVISDPAFTAGVTAWSACMRQRGHRVDSPADAHRLFADPATAPSRAKEIAMAVDEARCAASTGLADTAEQLDARYVAMQRNRYRSELLERERLQRAALPRAQALANQPPE